MATTNQNFTSLVPGGVNTQQTPLNTQPVVFGATQPNPYTTAPLPGQPSSNPYASTVPTAPTAATAPSPGSAIPSTTPAAGGTLSGAYGNLSPVIQSLLSSQGGYNPQAVAALLAQMQPGIAQGQQNLLEEFGAAGGRFSSAAASGLAQYNSNVQLDEGQIMAQLYEQSYQNYMNEVLGIGGQVESYQADQPNIWDALTGGVAAAKGVADIAQQFGA